MRSDLRTMRAVVDELAAGARPVPGARVPRTPLPLPTVRRIEPAPVPPPRTDLRTTLEDRRSVLRYGPDPVSTDLVLALLGEALRRDRRSWALDAAAGPLEAVVVALRSSDHPTGVYRVTADRADLVAGLDELGPPEDLGVQREFARACGMVVMYAGLDQADAWAGAHGYRVAMLRASMATYDFHLRSQAHGLVGTIFGGFVPSSVRHLVLADGVTRHALVAVTYAAPTPS